MTYSSSMCGAHVQFGGRPVPLLDLMDAWAQHVLRLYHERSTTLEATPTAWGLWDLGAANLIRDAISAACTAAGLDEPPVLIASDELFKSFTVESSPDWLRLMNEEPGSGWWWSRIPTSGPVWTESCDEDA